jgi:hypothetical protein
MAYNNEYRSLTLMEGQERGGGFREEGVDENDLYNGMDQGERK